MLQEFIDKGSLIAVPEKDEKGKITKINYKPSKDSPLNIEKLSNVPVYVEDGSVSISLDNEEMKGVENVRALVGFAKESRDSKRDYDFPYYFSIDGNVKADWESGLFKSNFNGECLTIDNKPVFVYTISDSTKRNKKGKKIGGSELCKIPINLNGEPRDFIISVEYPQKKCKIIGIAKQATMSSIVDNQLTGFSKGDVVMPLYLNRRKSINTLDDDNDAKRGKYKGWITISNSTIIIGENLPKLEFKTLPNGKYCYVFAFVSPVDSKLVDKLVFTEQLAIYTIKDGKINNIESATFEN